MNKPPKPGMSAVCSKSRSETGLLVTESSHWQEMACKVSQVRGDQIKKGSEIQHEKSELWQGSMGRERKLLCSVFVLHLIYLDHKTA